MLKRLLTTVFMVAAIAGLTSVARAQFMYIATSDSTGPGAYTMKANGTPTTLRVIVDTAHDDAAGLVPSGCDGDLTNVPDFGGYDITLQVNGGTVTWGGFVNNQAGATSQVGPDTTSTNYHLGFATTGTFLSPGKYQLATITVTGATGTPSIQFVPSFTFPNTNVGQTAIQNSACFGKVFDFALKYTTDCAAVLDPNAPGDWCHTAGVAAAGGAVDQAPIVTAPATQTVNEGVLLSFTVTASDPDAQAITSLTAAPLPAGATFTANGTFTSGTFSWTPTFTQAASYPVTFTAANALTGSATTTITVNNVDRAPVVTAPPTQTVNEGVALSFTVSASDPDGDGIISLSATGTAMAAGATFTAGAGNTSGTFSWTPSFTAAAGSPYSVTFTASNVLSGTATTAITVNNVNRAPVVTAPATASGNEGTLITFTVSASDPDGDAITSLTASGAAMAQGATFTANGSNTSGTFSWTPSFTAAASSPDTVVFTAANALSGAASTAIAVNNVDRAPTVTAPATQSANENALLSFTVTASDPDGDAITSLTAAPLPAGATFTPGAGNTSGTFSWTPTFTQAGSYPVTFTATNALSGSALTTITVNNVDRAPTVSAPATQTGAENFLLTFTVTALDPDGDAITNLTAVPLPTGATFTKNASNTSGTFNWTPTVGQAAGSPYSIVFTASNALSGTATTAITVSANDRPPVVTAPPSASGNENSLISFVVSASDPDAQGITSLTAAPLPTGATFTTNGSFSSGTFSWTPTFTQAGSYNVTFTASNALSGTAATAITVNNVDRAPAVTAPATVTGPENALLAFTVTATDPDGDALTDLTAAGTAITAGATFTKNASNTSGTLSWTPTFTQAGGYSVTFTASNALSGTGTTAITITNVNSPPIVTAPATASGPENALLTFTVSATDPDGDAIASLTAAPLPTGATFTANGSSTSGTFNWTPDFTQAGSYGVTFTATNALTGTGTTAITITNVDRAPAVTAPASVSGAEGSVLTFSVSAADPDGDAITSLTAAVLPAGAVFTAGAGNTSGTFAWTPTFTQAGSYNVTFTAANALSGTAATAITIANTDRAPVVTAPASLVGAENVLLTFNVTASDPDGDAITSLTAAPLPSGASFTANASHTSGTFSWTPGTGSSGGYSVVFTAANALSGTATTAITITTDNPPVVTAPATASGNEGNLITFIVTASDPDAQAITSLTAAGTALAAGASFTANASNTSGTFSWTPSFTQAGGYSATFTASNALSGSATTAITVNNVDRAPVVAAPASQTVNEGALLSFTVTASDPDGDAIASLTAAPLPAGATFTADAANTSGTFSWTPTAGQAGSYSVAFTASNALSGSATTAITVNHVNNCPVVTAPATASTDEGVLLMFNITATDADGEHVTLTATGLPTGATFTDNANNSGTFSWTPDFTAAALSPYTVTFHGSDGHAGCTGSMASTVITVNNVNRAPTAVITAPPSGTVGVPVNMSGSASTDPDGDALTYAWDFGDGGTGTGVSVSHTYTTGVGSPFTISLTVTDNGVPPLSNTAAQQITIVTCLPGTAFTDPTKGHGATVVALDKPRPFNCMQVQPLTSATFNINDVVLSSITLQRTDMVRAPIHANSKTALDSDTNLDGIFEITACFAKSDLRVLFAGLGNGTFTIPVEVDGSLVNGQTFCAPGQLVVKGSNKFLTATLSPNPFNPEAVLTFNTSKVGVAKVTMFDVSGRMVRSLVNESLAAGYHDVRIDGRGDNGAKLSSGIYFVKIETESDGSTVMKAMIMK